MTNLNPVFFKELIKKLSISLSFYHNVKNFLIIKYGTKKLFNYVENFIANFIHNFLDFAEGKTMRDLKADRKTAISSPSPKLRDLDGYLRRSLPKHSPSAFLSKMATQLGTKINKKIFF